MYPFFYAYTYLIIYILSYGSGNKNVRIYISIYDIVILNKLV